jgi:hypothetical protein
MELARNIPGDADTGRGGAGIGSGSAGLSVRDLRRTIIRVGVSKGDVRNQVRERHGGRVVKCECGGLRTLFALGPRAAWFYGFWVFVGEEERRSRGGEESGHGKEKMICRGSGG